MKILKRLGRLSFVLTEEERYIKPETINAVLIICAGEPHCQSAQEVTGKRFPQAEIKTIQCRSAKDMFLKLYRLREEQISAVIVLSLNPIVIFFVSVFFSRYFLIYNRFGQWFLIRKKTLYEFLIGRRGADREKEDWNAPHYRISFAKFIIPLIFFPFVLIKIFYQVIKLFFYLAFNLSYLFLRKSVYTFIK